MNSQCYPFYSKAADEKRFFFHFRKKKRGNPSRAEPRKNLCEAIDPKRRHRERQRGRPTSCMFLFFGVLYLSLISFLFHLGEQHAPGSPLISQREKESIFSTETKSRVQQQEEINVSSSKPFILSGFLLYYEVSLLLLLPLIPSLLRLQFALLSLRVS